MRSSATSANSFLSNSQHSVNSQMNSRPKSIVARASCRVDLAGGTLDLWPLYLFHPGAVTVNFAVDVMTSCRITPNKSGEIHLHSLDTGKQDRFASTSALLRS